MNNRYRSKTDVEISSFEIIDFLKKEKLYISSNGIENISTNVSPLENSNPTSLSWIGDIRYDINQLNSNILIVKEKFENKSNNKSIIYTSNPKLATVLIL
ncbi:hypothetical protein GSY74_05510, partial [Sulfurovum sp. bin170]|uniref:hypothetical protein n=1 Tax=Sulfurovum sp. bin170 TaxID=2695268 RepID=UPI0013E0829F